MDKKETKHVGTLILMAIGFVVSGVMGAATAAELPGAIKQVGEVMAGAKKEESKAEEQKTE